MSPAPNDNLYIPEKFKDSEPAALVGMITRLLGILVSLSLAFHLWSGTDVQVSLIKDGIEIVMAIAALLWLRSRVVPVGRVNAIVANAVETNTSEIHDYLAAGAPPEPSDPLH